MLRCGGLRKVEVSKLDGWRWVLMSKNWESRMAEGEAPFIVVDAWV
jgi:hypothetical protein